MAPEFDGEERWGRGGGHLPPIQSLVRVTPGGAVLIEESSMLKNCLMRTDTAKKHGSKYILANCTS